jgi:hypothetical protein
MEPDTQPEKFERYYVTRDFAGYNVMDWYSRGGWFAKHSTHPTREEAEAVALALNRLSE